MSEVIEIRASSLSGYVDCARRSAANIFSNAITAAGYTLRHTPQNIGAMIGTAMHEGCHFSLENKMKNGEIGSDAEARDFALESLENALSEDDVIYDRKVTFDKNDAIYQVQSLLNVCRRDVIPNITPLMVEKRLKAQVGNIILSGQVDMGVQTGVNDWKSGTKRHHINQMGAYGLLARTHNFPSEKLNEIFIPRVKTDQHQPTATFYSYDSAVAENSALAVTKRIGRDFEEFQKTGNRFAFMANPSSMLCSDKYCKAYGTDFCREHKKKDN